MSALGIICYLISMALFFWIDWRLAIGILNFYIAFKIEIYDYRESSDNKIEE